MKSRTRIAATFVLMLAGAVALSGCATMAQNGAMSRARRAMAHGKYPFALEKLADAEHYVPPEPALHAQIIFLRAECLEQMDRLRDAIGTYRFVAEKFPDTEYAYRARERLRLLEPPARGP